MNKKYNKPYLSFLSIIFILLTSLLLFDWLKLSLGKLSNWLLVLLPILIVIGFFVILSLKYDGEELIGKKTLFFFTFNILFLILVLLPDFVFLEKISLPWLPLKILNQQSSFFQIAGASLCLSFFAVLFLPKKIWGKINPGNSYIYYLIAILSLVYIIFGFIKYKSFSYDAYDFGIAIQGIWHYSELKLAYTTLAIIDGGLQWGDHFHPIWIFAAPLFWIWKDPRMLLILDSVIVCLGALPIFWIARMYLDRLPSLIIAFSYLLFFGVQFALNFPFRGDTLGTTFLAFAVFYLLKQKWGKYFIFVLLALMCKENFSIYIFFLGLYALIRKNWWPGIITLITGMTWYFFTVHYFIPAMRPAGDYAFFTYQELGPNLTAAIKNIFLHPFNSLSVFFSPDIKLYSMLALVCSLSFLPLFVPSVLIMAVPMLAERFFSSNNALWETCFHYSVTITPILFVAAIFSINKLNVKPFLKKITPGKKSISIILSISIFLSVILTGYYLDAPLLQVFKKGFYQNPKEKDMIAEAFSFIENDAAVSAQSPLVPRLAMRSEIFLFPQNIDKSKYIVLNTQFHAYPISSKNELAGYISQIIESDDWGLVYSKESVLLFKKGAQNSVELSQNTVYFLKKYDKLDKN